MTDAERREKALAAIASMAEDLKEIVATIEDSTPQVRGNYDKYSVVIRKMAKTRTMEYAVALALMEAGANPRGVRDAVTLIKENLL